MSDIPAGPPVHERFVFTGDGAEYFRIWVVNAVLSLLTLGIYSAWAKVRKSSYFARNTRLAGDTFEFAASPRAILRGRVLALALIALYTYSFEFSLTLGLTTTVFLVAVAPLLFASATRFRLRNTRWRGLRFDFVARHSDAYRAMTVVVAVWVSGTVAAALADAPAITASFAVATGLLLPWLHHRVKAFQHRHVAFAGSPSSFTSALGSFYGIYLVTGLILFLTGIAATFVVGAAVTSFKVSGEFAAGVFGVLTGAAAAAVAWLAAWPFFATHLQRAVWERTTIGPFSFRTSIAVKDAFLIAAKNIGLLLVTAGLYWPFASIAWARYRIGCMQLVGPSSLEAATVGGVGPSSATFGEGAIDFFGIDVGW
jgi:uncharacterized membrane protein YjgN (DUF898 family)